VFDVKKIVKSKIPIVVDKIKILIRELNGIYHSKNIGFVTNEFGSEIYTKKLPGLYEKEGNVYLTELHQYIPDALIGIRIHILDFFSDETIELMTSSDDGFELIMISIYIQIRTALYDYGSACGIVSGQCIQEPYTQMSLDSIHLGA
jgi:hypothetical protein